MTYPSKPVRLRAAAIAALLTFTSRHEVERRFRVSRRTQNRWLRILARQWGEPVRPRQDAIAACWRALLLPRLDGLPALFDLSLLRPAPPKKDRSDRLAAALAPPPARRRSDRRRPPVRPPMGDRTSTVPPT